MRRPWESTAAWQSRLAARARAGDREAFRELYRSLYPAVAAFVARRVRTPADAEDAVSRTFHVLLEKLHLLDPARGSPLGYALAIARTALGEQRARAARIDPGAPPAEVEDAVPGALDLLLREESLRAVAAGVAELPEDTRGLLALRFGDGLRHAEIAALTGLSEAAVKQRVSRALRELRAGLSRSAPGAEEVVP